MKDEDLHTVQGIRVAVTCYYCKGKKRFPGGRYKAEGEVINCPICNGTGTTGDVITLDQLRTLLGGAT